MFIKFRVFVALIVLLFAPMSQYGLLKDRSSLLSAVKPKQNYSHEVSTQYSTNYFATGDRWYIHGQSCGTLMTVCCCDDGNSYVCSLPGMSFYCTRGGSFACGSDLGDCEENPSECGPCCSPHSGCA